MHERVYNFIAEMKALHPELFAGRKVLEYGSYNINGSVRPLFNDCSYVGLDWRLGPEVDEVSLMHKFSDDRRWDTIITSSAVEHDPYWVQSLIRIMEVLATGGSFILTCGGPEYEGHCYETSPPLEEPQPTPYYRGITSDEIKDVVSKCASFAEIIDKSDRRDTMLMFREKLK